MKESVKEKTGKKAINMKHKTTRNTEIINIEKKKKKRCKFQANLNQKTNKKNNQKEIK